MSKRKLILAAGICFLITGIIGKAQQAGVLIIEASNFESSNGKAVVNLFRPQDDIPEKPFKQLMGEILNGKATISFGDIPYGEYAIILFHDKNANGILDHRLGFPNEPMGFSNQWKLSLFSGMPTFTKLKFRFDKMNLKYSIPIY